MKKKETLSHNKRRTDLYKIDNPTENYTTLFFFLVFSFFFNERNNERD